ncbi:CCR4-NOT transcription complex subunit 3 isoform X2 [Musca vetustissima]|uniref:CCR4-NOT transcription complex subunit 3 isoform X2 n=1 Tax=Musca vetustissima TaxID=27455 RepID=UPI002AB5FD05|nr:CCR4-NOT transcription complex subunit 3 isoform X2 [Musca vetustissima]
MAATRKLQGEIDRCLKKVAEGVETFEDIWKKVHNATNSNQKEKYEADLKKEIKKLQRLRDQIKSWIASAEIKDKSSLLENRRLIETQMERFKVVERETKTKAYSKEGLGAAQKMDPAQRIKDEARNWLTNSISSLQIQIDQYESEIESLLAGKKKRLDRDKQDRMDELRSKLDRHKFHVTKLETLLRLLDNDNVEAEQVNKIKDDVEYYIDSSQEPDFEENEFIYDDIIGIDDVEYSGTGVSLGIPSSATTDSNNSNETSGSPSSITSGGSPVQSPLPTQQQRDQQQQQQASNTSGSGGGSAHQQISLNYSSDSTAADGTAKDKHNKNESNNNSKTKQPVKPTAVRANNKANIGASDATTNKIISSTPSKNPHQQQQQQQQQHHPTQQQQQQQQPTAAAVVAASVIGNHSTTNNLNTAGSGGATTLAAAVAAAGGHNNPSVQHAPAPTLQGNPTLASVAAASTNSTNATQIQGQSVIQATPTIAFSAVAKHNTSHLENGPLLSGASYAIVGGSSGQQQLTNLQANSSHLQNAHNTSNNSAVGSIANVVQQGANSTNVNNLATSAANCISPNGMSGLQQVLNAQQQVLGLAGANSNARASPGLLSPKHMNGLPVSSVANNTNSVDAISLKTMAQEAINRSVIDTNSLSQQQQQQQQATNMDTRQQQQQQQQQQPQVLQQHFSTDTTANSHQQQQQQQQQQGNSATVLAAAVAASTNGPSSVVGSNSAGAGSGGNSVGPIGSNLNASALSNAAGQQPIGAGASSANNNKQLSQQPTNEAHIPPLLGVAPLGPSPLQKEHQLQFQMMEAAYYHLPTPSDSEKLTTYFHRTPVQTPPHYPQQQLPIYDTVEFYQRLSTETLFFVFYYMEGSKAQYLAAKALKKQSWRFHTKYMMWFQRHEEPKIINDDYEQGTYIYFDYEKWSQRKKEGFTFEYKYLEDKELN